MFLSAFISHYNHKDKSLNLNLKNEKGRPLLARLASWEQGMVLKVIKGKLEDFDFLDAEASLFNKAHDSNQQLPIHAYIQQIPQHIRDIAGRDLDNQCRLVRLFSYGKQAEDLYHTNRMLFYCVAYHTHRLPNVKQLLQKKQSHILQTLYPHNHSRLSYASVVRVLKKVLDTADENRLQMIDDFISCLFNNNLPCDNEKVLLHVKYIPLFFLHPDSLPYILRLHPDVLFAPIQKIVDGEPSMLESPVTVFNSAIVFLVDYVLNFCRDCIDMLSVLGKSEAAIYKIIKQARSHNELEDVHHKILLQVQQHDREQLQPAPDTDNSDYAIEPVAFEHIEPPIPKQQTGNISILPLLNGQAFEAESKAMNHCLAYAGYGHAVAQGESYIYKVTTSKDRCTLELGITGERQYRIKQLRGYHNQAPRPETRQLVEGWIRHNGQLQKDQPVMEETNLQWDDVLFPSDEGVRLLGRG